MPWKLIGVIFLSILLAIPVTFFVAIGSVPMLRGIEVRWDIEVVGHSGPAEWVIYAIWLVISVAIAGTIWLLHGNKGKAE